MLDMCFETLYSNNEKQKYFLADLRVLDLVYAYKVAALLK